MLVTDRDLAPNGFLCETCGREFQVGDTAHGNLLAVCEDGTPVEGGYECTACYWLTRR